MGLAGRKSFEDLKGWDASGFVKEFSKFERPAQFLKAHGLTRTNLYLICLRLGVKIKKKKQPIKLSAEKIIWYAEKEKQ